MVDTTIDDSSSAEGQETCKPPAGLEVPIDILFLIFTYLPPSTLSACCRLSKRTHPTAFDALYRHIRPTSRNILDLIFRLSQPLPNASSADGTPELLATKVHSFVISEAKSSFDMYLGNIQDLLPKLTRLKVLVLDLTPTSAWILPKVGLNTNEEEGEKRPAFRLKTFHCSLQYDSTLGDFLDTQPDILTLIVRAPVVTNPLPVLPSTFLPKLTFLQAPWKLAAALVPGRPISDLITWHLTMNSARDQSPNANAEAVAYLDEDPDISCLSRSTSEGGLKRHFINWSFLSVQGPEKLGQAAPGLVRFSIDADGVDPSDEPSQDEIVEFLTDLLPYTKSLDSIYIRFHPLRSVIPCRDIDFSDMVTSIFSSSRKLKDVVITFLGLKARYFCRRAALGEEWCIVNG